MPVLMGGSGSTGSSLLRTVLNRHPELFSGEELNFFNKEIVFDNWGRARRLIFGNRLLPPFATHGWFDWPGHQLQHQDYEWSISELQDLMERSNSVTAFADAYFARALEREKASDWVEKTPSNAYSFGQFLRDFSDGKVIHTTRDPFATVASLVHRGMTPVFAAGLWIYNTAAALAAHENPRYHLVRYEDLTNDASQTVESLCAFIGVRYDPDVLHPKEADGTDHLKSDSWKRSRTDPIVTSPSRFTQLEPDVQRQISAALTLLIVSESHVAAKAIRFRSCAEIAAVVGYPFEPLEDVSPADAALVKRSLRADRWRRIRRRLPTGLSYYPLEIDRQRYS